MRIAEKIKHGFRREPPTQEQLDARAEAEAARKQLLAERGKADLDIQAARNIVPPGF